MAVDTPRRSFQLPNTMSKKVAVKMSRRRGERRIHGFIWALAPNCGTFGSTDYQPEQARAPGRTWLERLPPTAVKLDLMVLIRRDCLCLPPHLSRTTKFKRRRFLELIGHHRSIETRFFGLAERLGGKLSAMSASARTSDGASWSVDSALVCLSA